MPRQHFRDLRFVCLFFYDIRVYSKSWEVHLSHFQRILTLLLENKLYAKRSKCRFGVTKVDYLGHIITAKGVTMDPAKIEAVQAWPIPTTVREVQGFLGLASYYRKFILHFGGLVAHLTQLLTKNGFH